MSTTYHEPTGELSAMARSVHRALATLIEELEAVDWYQQRIDVVNGFIKLDSRLLNNSVYFINTTTIFPGSSPAAHSSILTGYYPTDTGINGIDWFDRNTAEFRAYRWQELLKGEIATENLENDLLKPTIFNKANQSGFTSGAFGGIQRKDVTHRNGETSIGTIIATSTRKDPIFSPSIHIMKLGDSIMLESIEMAYKDYIFYPKFGNLQSFIPNEGNLSVVFMMGYHEASGERGPVSSQADELIEHDINLINSFYGTLQNLNMSDDTLIVLISDHGQTATNDSKNIPKSELEDILEENSFDIGKSIIGTYDYEDATAVVATIGGAAHVYLRYNSSFAGDWIISPNDETVNLVAQHYFNERPEIAEVLVRYSGNTEYEVYVGNNITEYLDTLDSDKYPYPERVNELYWSRSGDIILLANSSAGYYFHTDQAKGEHGGLFHEDTYVPMMFIHPRFGGCLHTDANFSVVDMAPTVAELMGFNMSGVDGQSLYGYIQDCMWYYVNETINISFT
ncbi:MAG: alkaline phosphatase family protein, partial [Pirellulaceae bacterium]